MQLQRRFEPQLAWDLCIIIALRGKLLWTMVSPYWKSHPTKTLFRFSCPLTSPPVASGLLRVWIAKQGWTRRNCLKKLWENQAGYDMQHWAAFGFIHNALGYETILRGGLRAAAICLLQIGLCVHDKLHSIGSLENFVQGVGDVVPRQRD